MEQEVLEEESAIEGCLYEVDETLTPVQAVLKYSLSDLTPQRHAFIRGISAVAHQTASEVIDPQAKLEQLQALANLALELLAPGHEWDDDPDTLGLTLDQLPALGLVLHSTITGQPIPRSNRSSSATNPEQQTQPPQPPPSPTHIASVHQQLLSLVEACQALTLSLGGEDEVLVNQCVEAQATLLAYLPLHVAQPVVIQQVDSMLRGGGGGDGGGSEGGEPHLVCAGLALLGAYAEKAAEGGAGMGGLETQGKGDEGGWRDVLLSAKACVVQPDVDEAVQQGFLHHLHAIGLLLPPSERASQLMLPACLELGTSQVWAVRAAVATAIPAVIDAMAVEASCSSSSSQLATAGHATADTNGLGLPPAVTELVELLCVRLAKDVSQWVRNAAVKAAGPTVTALARVSHSKPPQSLIDCYCSCVGGMRPLPPDVLQTAAEHLTHVAQAMMTHGSHPHDHLSPPAAPTESIQPDLTGALVTVYTGLLAVGGQHVVHSLTEQLPGLIVTIGADVVAGQLLPCLLRLDDLGLRTIARQALLPHTATLVETLSSASVSVLLGFVMEGLVVEEGGVARASGSGAGHEWCGAWRDRLAFARQIQRLAVGCCRGGGADVLTGQLLPCVRRLCEDPVWAVRHAAAGQLGETLCWAAAVDHGREVQGNVLAVGGVTDAVLSTVLELIGVHDSVQEGVGSDGECVPETKLAQLRLLLEVCLGFLRAGMDGEEVVVEDGWVEDQSQGVGMGGAVPAALVGKMAGLKECVVALRQVVDGADVLQVNPPQLLLDVGRVLREVCNDL